MRSLLAAFARIDQHDEFWIFTNRETGSDLIPCQHNFHWAPQSVRASIRPARILWEQFLLPLAVRRAGPDVLFNPGFTCPLLAPCPNITVFHDLQHKRHPEYFRWFDLPFWRLLLWASARHSRALISDSQATRADLLHFYGLDSRVIPLGADPVFFEIAARREPQDYLLCVSTLHPHKNLERLLRVHAAIPEAPPLVITGLRGFAARDLEKVAGPRARFTGWIPRAELLDLYRRARAFIYPSTFEGFGLPVLEAMAAGIPLACSDIPPLREIAGDDAIYFDPLDDAAIRAAIFRVCRDDTLVLPARQRAEQFTWEKTARATLQAIKEAAA